MGGACPQAAATDAIHCPLLACGPGCGPDGESIRLSHLHVPWLPRIWRIQ
jgi:hypothetical protein